MYSLILTLIKKYIVQSLFFFLSNVLVDYQIHRHGFTTLFLLAKIVLEYSIIYDVVESMIDFICWDCLQRKHKNSL